MCCPGLWSLLHLSDASPDLPSELGAISPGVWELKPWLAGDAPRAGPQGWWCVQAFHTRQVICTSSGEIVWIIPTSHSRHLRFKEVGQLKATQLASGRARSHTHVLSWPVPTLPSPHSVTCEGPELLSSAKQRGMLGVRGVRGGSGPSLLPG